MNRQYSVGFIFIFELVFGDWCYFSCLLILIMGLVCICVEYFFCRLVICVLCSFFLYDDFLVLSFFVLGFKIVKLFLDGGDEIFFFLFLREQMLDLLFELFLLDWYLLVLVFFFNVCSFVFFLVKNEGDDIVVCVGFF